MSGNDNILIDGWHIDASSCRISRNGDEKKLEPRSMELLSYLADHPDQVVTREEIEENVWQGRVVGYDALSNAIAKIRKAFGDSSKQPRVIETISKVGYRLIAPVVVEVIDSLLNLCGHSEAGISTSIANRAEQDASTTAKYMPGLMGCQNKETRT
jgi:DNA-binding winged helix-turn-helix (wHTH) protein